MNQQFTATRTRVFLALIAIFRNHNKIALRGMAHVFSCHLAPSELHSLIKLLESVNRRKRGEEEIPDEQKV